MNAHIERMAREAGFQDLPTVRLAYNSFRLELFARLIAEDLVAEVKKLAETGWPENSQYGSWGEFDDVTKAIWERYK